MLELEFWVVSFVMRMYEYVRKAWSITEDGPRYVEGYVHISNLRNVTSKTTGP